MNSVRNPSTGLTIFIKACVTLYVLLSGCFSTGRAGVFHARDEAVAPQLEVIYFIPQGQLPDEACHERIDSLVRGAKAYFDRWMDFWGYPHGMRLSYAAASGRIQINTVHGKFNLPHYITSGVTAIKSEIDQWYLSRGEAAAGHTTLIFTSVMGGNIAGVPFCAKGSYAFVMDAPNAGMDLPVAASHIKRAQDLTTGIYHELGHALGLPHNWGNRSDNERFGHTLMGSGDGHSVSRTYLSAADCALLSSSPVFSTAPSRSPDLRLLGITGTNNGTHASINGKFSISNDSVVSVLFYNDCFVDGYGDNLDYDASSWKGVVINNDSFSVQMQYRDFRYSYDTAYQLRIGFCTKQSGTKWMSFTYAMENGIFSGTLRQVEQPFNSPNIIAVAALLATGLLFMYHKKKI